MAEVDAEDAPAVRWSLGLIVGPPTMWFWLVAPDLVVLCGHGVALALSVAVAVLLLLSLLFFFVAMLTEPGILRVENELCECDENSFNYLDTRSKTVPRVVLHGDVVTLDEARAKVCRQTDTCIAHFDHFCPWVGNAIGRRNYRSFVGLLAAVDLLAATVGASCVLLLVESMRAQGAVGWSGFVAALETVWAAALLAAVAGLALACVCTLTLFHLFLIAVNSTTNEYLRGRWDARDRPNPHDRGCLRNFWRFFTASTPGSQIAEYEQLGHWCDVGMPGAHDDPAGMLPEPNDVSLVEYGQYELGERSSLSAVV